jgi:hypothetical protein
MHGEDDMRHIPFFTAAVAAALMAASAAAQDKRIAESDITFSLGSVTPRIAAQPCTQAAFSAVTHRTSSMIDALNEQQARLFRARLETLRASYGWSEREMLAYAGPMMQDEAIIAIDAQSQRLVGELTSLSGEGRPGNDKRCKTLARVEAIMAQLVVNTRMKWRLLLASVDMALASAHQDSAVSAASAVSQSSAVSQYGLIDDSMTAERDSSVRD